MIRFNQPGFKPFRYNQFFKIVKISLWVARLIKTCLPDDYTHNLISY